MGIDLLSISAHKLYGPKGIGALYMRKKNPKLQLQPIMYGGGHEQGICPGTLAVPNIVGFSKACEILQNVMDTESLDITALRDQLMNIIQSEIYLEDIMIYI